MNISKITVIISVILIILSIGIPTTYKVIKNHYDHLYQVVEDKIIEKAKECYYDNICLEDKITLQELYDNKYLEVLSNPVSKEYYNSESYVKHEDNKFEFVVVE